MKSVYEMVAGLDAHKKTVVVVVLHNAQPDCSNASGIFGTTQNWSQGAGRISSAT